MTSFVITQSEASVFNFNVLMEPVMGQPYQPVYSV